MTEKLLFLASIILLSHEIYADTDKLMREFLKVNSTLKLNSARASAAEYDLNAVKGSRPFSLIGSMSSTDSKLDTGTTGRQDGTLSNYNIGIAKEFVWGGTVSLQGEYYDYDRSGYSPTLLASMGTPAMIKEFRQGLTYVQDLGSNFFGMDTREKERVAALNLDYVTVDATKVEQSALFDFYLACIDARLKKTIVKLENEAYQRALQRKIIIKKRVKDGLREMADLYQARMEEVAQRENYQSAKVSFNNAVDNISQALHRNVGAAEVDEYDLDNFVMSDRSKGDTGNNLEIKATEEKIGLLKSQLRRADNSIFPDIKFTTKYTTNNFDDSSSTAFKESTLSNDREITLALNATWPIGFEPQKNERAKIALQLQNEQYRLEALNNSTKNSEKILQREIELLNENLMSVKNRRDLAIKLLSEYNKLYNLGRADLDQVIRSEESLINTEKSFSGYITNRYKLSADLALLRGRLYEAFGLRGTIR